MGCCTFLLITRRQGNRKINTRLMIFRVGGDGGFERGHITGGGSLLGEIDRGLHTGDGCERTFVRRDKRKRLLGAL